VLAASLALSSSVLWGICDFAGGMLARRFAVVAVVVLSQASGVAALAAVSPFAGVSIDANALKLGLFAGLFGAGSLAAFYQAMALGLMSVASPLLACGSVLAFGLAVAAGERPSELALLGAPLALAGAVLVSFHEHESGGARRSSLPYALVAPVALGFYLFLLGRASDEGGSVSAVLGARLGSLAVLVLLALVVRPSFSIGIAAFAVVMVLGLVATGSLVLFGYAADLGLISIASILSSLYPLVTMLLAHAFLGERLRTAQLAGVSLALGGIVLVTLS
jgi:drug/metabolite transporter (DMT)-like permease